MRFNLFILPVCLGLAGVVLLTGCGPATSSSSTAPASPARAVSPGTTNSATTQTNQLGPQIFFVKGEITELKAGTRRIVIKHEDIPNYMPAMTMPFDVKDPKELQNLKVGDKISFRMLVTEDEGWIDRLVVLENAGMGKPPTRPTTRLVRDVVALQIGDPMPNYPFTNQLGQAVTFSQYRGQALALTFIFTRCPFPNFCPRMSDNFSKTYAQLMASKNGPTNFHLFSMSFDTDYDTPEHLKSYAEHYHYDPNYWSFLTGALIDIDALTEQFGLVFPRELGTFQFNHNMRTVVIDTQGRVQQIIAGNEWKPEELAAELIKAAAVPVNGTNNAPVKVSANP